MNPIVVRCLLLAFTLAMGSFGVYDILEGISHNKNGQIAFGLWFVVTNIASSYSNWKFLDKELNS